MPCLESTGSRGVEHAGKYCATALCCWCVFKFPFFFFFPVHLLLTFFHFFSVLLFWFSSSLFLFIFCAFCLYIFFLNISVHCSSYSKMHIPFTFHLPQLQESEQTIFYFSSTWGFSCHLNSILKNLPWKAQGLVTRPHDCNSLAKTEDLI